MKKFILFNLCILLVSFSGFSQDLITKKNNEDIKAKVIEVSVTDVSYKKFETPEGPIYRVPKSEILMIRYADGSKDVFSDLSTDNMGSKGKEDARANYHGKNSGAGWTAATVIVTSPVLGLIPAIVCSSSEPQEDNLNVRKPELMKNDSYNQAYLAEAHKIKKGKVWKNYGIASGVWVAIILLL